MLDTILSVLAVLLLFFSVYAVVMCLLITREGHKAEKEFWEQHTERRKRV